MVSVLVRDKNGLDRFNVQPCTPHPFLRFAARNTGVYQHSLFLVAYIIAISITPGIERTDKK
jgi:hypothetical protein